MIEGLEPGPDRRLIVQDGPFELDPRMRLQGGWLLSGGGASHSDPKLSTQTVSPQTPPENEGPLQALGTIGKNSRCRLDERGHRSGRPQVVLPFEKRCPGNRSTTHPTVESVEPRAPQAQTDHGKQERGLEQQQTLAPRKLTKAGPFLHQAHAGSDRADLSCQPCPGSSHALEREPRALTGSALFVGCEVHRRLGPVPNLWIQTADAKPAQRRAD